MSKIIERIVKDYGAPNENDLWLDKGDSGLTLKAYDAGEWKTVAGGGSGGGGAANAVTYGVQDLTEVQKMQARKNLGLYYEEETDVPGEIEMDAEASYETMNFGGVILYRISDTTYGYRLDDIESVLDSNGGRFNFAGQEVSDAGYLAMVECASQDESEAGAIILANDFHGADGVPPGFDELEGIYVTDAIKKIIFKTDNIARVEEKYLPSSVVPLVATITKTPGELEPTFRCDVPFTEVKGAMLQGRFVTFIITLNSGQILGVTSNATYVNSAYRDNVIITFDDDSLVYNINGINDGGHVA